jgi:hypothetical protein
MLASAAIAHEYASAASASVSVRKFEFSGAEPLLLCRCIIAIVASAAKMVPWTRTKDAFLRVYCDVKRRIIDMMTSTDVLQISIASARTFGIGMPEWDSRFCRKGRFKEIWELWKSILV